MSGIYGRPTQRIEPTLGAENMKTYAIEAPLTTHWRRGTCEETECRKHQNGWYMDIDLSTQLGQQQAAYIKHQSGRHFTHEKLNNEGMVRLTFPAGQTCFQEHKVRLDREERYIVKGGDFRGNPRGIPTRVHDKPEHWIEDFQENQEAIIDAKQKG